MLTVLVRDGLLACLGAAAGRGKRAAWRGGEGGVGAWQKGREKEGVMVVTVLMGAMVVVVVVVVMMMACMWLVALFVIALTRQKIWL